MKRLVCLLVSVVLTTIVHAEDETNKTLTIDDIFPTNRVLDVQIALEPTDWNTIHEHYLIIKKN